MNNILNFGSWVSDMLATQSSFVRILGLLLLVQGMFWVLELQIQEQWYGYLLHP
jgi:hypothetical protein